MQCVRDTYCDQIQQCGLIMQEGPICVFCKEQNLFILEIILEIIMNYDFFS